jgi:diaminohydroxyphosphoribosylaminopyrimidine deaminase / 5-amino-6-(5-phosphoribosylamino)uracil reductase
MRDARWMARALWLAGRARGQTSPNPMVGAVVVTPAGLIAGQGYHERAGEPHAEVHALAEAGPLARGATLFCTLEPCSHHGRTPPCVERIVEAGIARVVAATVDPNPRVAGSGFRHLEQHGIVVEVGLMASDAERLNRPFFTAMRLQRPWVIAKVALSADGAVAERPGQSTALSSTPANRASQLLRAEVDAIGVGSETVRIDDPLLTCRDVYRARPLTRVVFDRRLRVGPDAALLRTAAEAPVVVVTSPEVVEARPEYAKRLTDAGASVLEVSGGLAEACAALLSRYGVQSLLLEGGPTLHRAAFEAGVVDALRAIVTPRKLGASGVPWLEHGASALPSLSEIRVEPCGPDVIIQGDVYRID